MPPALRRNLELKARTADLAAARDVCRRLGARPPEMQRQTDTYFRVPHGRLKLREIEDRPAVLIWYDRPDREAARGSDYHLVPVEAADLLKAALTAALGVRGTVCKRREIHLWHNVRIHLDEVEGLGTFLEFEAVLSPADDEATAAARLARFREAFGIRPDDLVASSYAELRGL
jgi:adenylate cyclase, class 2